MKYYVLAFLTLAAGLAIGFRHDLMDALHLHDHGYDSHARSSDRDRSERASQASRFQWEGHVEAGDWVEIRGTNGGIEAVGTSGSEVVVLAEKTSKRGRVDAVRIEVVQHGDGVTICSIYPGRRSNANCAPGGGGSNVNVRNSDVVVKYHVSIPDGVKFRGITVNGGVSAEGLTGAIEANTVNGSMDLETLSWAEAHTVNGSIRANVGTTSPGGDMRFATTNGRITLAVPSDLAASIEGRTMSGSIQSAFPLDISGRYGQKRLEGVLGGGGPRIELATVNGSIELVERN